MSFRDAEDELYELRASKNKQYVKTTVLYDSIEIISNKLTNKKRDAHSVEKYTKI